MANVSLMRNKKHVCTNMCIIIYVYLSNIQFCHKIHIQVLTFGQAYKISLQLEMPDSPINQALGMFMIKTTFLSQNEGQVTSSAQPVRLVHHLCGCIGYSW